MAYCGALLLAELAKTIREKNFHLKTYVRNNLLYLGVFVLWILQQIYEINGGRAGQFECTDLKGELSRTVMILFQQFREINRCFAVVTAVVVLAGLVVLIIKWRDTYVTAVRCELKVLLIAVMLTVIYLLLLSARVEPTYIARKDVLLGIFFYGFLIMFSLMAVLTEAFPRVLSVVPFLILVLYCNICVGRETFKEPNQLDAPYETCKAINIDILEQLQAAIEAGETSVVLYVPDCHQVDNWPLAYGEDKIQKALIKHGVIPYDRYFDEAEMVPTMEKNKQFGLE